jgi:hypothetical protein
VDNPPDFTAEIDPVDFGLKDHGVGVPCILRAVGRPTEYRAPIRNQTRVGMRAGL